MNTKINYKGIFRSGRVVRFLSIYLLTSQIFINCNSARAQDVRLEQLQPTLDTSTPAFSPIKKLLNGQVSQERSQGESLTEVGSPAGGKVVINIQSADGASSLSALQMQAITDALSKIGLSTGTSDSSSAIRKPSFLGITQHARSAQDIRAMEYGIIGMVSTKYDGASPEVSQVFPTCPAALAGIMPGDLVIKSNGHVFTKSEGPREFWQRIGGKAGSPVAVTVLRNGELLTFNMSRMNIEDIVDLRVRSRYERVLGFFGPPSGEGVQIARQHEHLPLVQNEQQEDSTLTELIPSPSRSSDSNENP